VDSRRKQWAIIRHQEGSTVIEFALVAPIVFIMVFGIIEFSLMMFASSVIENATTAAARYGITGNSYDVAPSADACNTARGNYIRRTIDTMSMGLMTAADIRVTTEVFDDFASVSPTGNSATADYGCGGQTVLYHVQYNWKVITPLIAQFFTNGMQPLSASILVKNEKF
jgi:Flp pilus assembly protein TadG